MGDKMGDGLTKHRRADVIHTAVQQEGGAAAVSPCKAGAEGGDGPGLCT